MKLFLRRKILFFVFAFTIGFIGAFIGFEYLNPFKSLQSSFMALQDTSWNIQPGLGTKALAATQDGKGHLEEHEVHVPDVVFYQILNFLLFVGLLFYFLKDWVRAAYLNRHNLFHKQFEASKKEREAMEASYQDYQEKLQNISITEKQQIQKAEKDAQVMKARTLETADLESQRILRQAQALLDLEDRRWQQQIQVAFSKQLHIRLQGEISKHIQPEDHKQLIQKFTEQVVSK